MFVSAWFHEGLSQVNFWVYNKGIEIFKIEKKTNSQDEQLTYPELSIPVHI